MVHGDVFRPPENIMLFAASIGTGTQILVMTTVILSLAILGIFFLVWDCCITKFSGAFYPGSRGTLYKSAIFLYALTAGIGGYIAAKLYTELGGEKWASLAVLTATLFSAPLFVVFCVCNTVAIAYGATSALPFGVILLVIILWAMGICFVYFVCVLI